MIRAMLRAACFMAGAAGAVLLVYISSDIFASAGSGIDRSQWIEEHIKSFLSGFGSFLSPSRIEMLAASYPYWTMAGIGGVAGLIRSARVAAWAYQRYFDTFDPHVLMPVRRPAGLEIKGGEALPWVEPAGSRFMLWNDLFTWATEEPPVRSAFRWILLVGRPGIGKTRTANEFARRLARRDVFGTVELSPGKKYLSGRLRAFHLAWGAYLRNLWGHRHVDDPWDAGELDSDFLQDRSESLAQWIPRRPTLLVLDDPKGDDIKNGLEILGGRAGSFRYPVRLLIVSQTIPKAVAERLEARDPRGRAPLKFAENAVFTSDEITWLAGRIPGPASVALERPHDLQHFIDETEQIPLLVELGLDWVKNKRPLREMSGQGLLQDRASRLVVAVKQADADVLAIAAATLCGGATRKGLKKRLSTLPTPSQLAGVFPFQAESLRVSIPPVRPTMIGDEFVREVVQGAEDIAIDVAEAAWVANPGGTLRALPRLILHNDVLAAVLKAGPPADWPGSRYELALAYAEHCIRTDRDIHIAQREIRLLAPAEADAHLKDFSGLLATVGARAGSGLACYACVLEQVLRDGSLLTATPEAVRALHATADAIRWGGERGYRNQADIECLVAPACALVERAGLSHASLDRCEELVDALQDLGDSLWTARDVHGPAAISILRLLAAAPILNEGRQTCLRVQVLALERKPEEAMDLAERFDSAAGDDPAGMDIVAEVWRAAAFSLRGAGSVASAWKLESIAQRVGESLRAPLSRTVVLSQSWIYADAIYVCATSSEEGASEWGESIAQRMDSELASFVGDRSVELARIDGWRLVIYKFSTQPGGSGQAEQLAAGLESFGAGLGAVHAFALKRVKAWGYVVYAYGNQDGGAARSEEIAERVDTLALPFAGDRGFELERARAWRYVAFAYSKQEGGAARSEEIAERVDTLALPFAGDREFELQRARAWASVAFAYSSQEGGAARSEEAAERVDTLALPFADDREFELERAQAWRSVAVAYSNQDGGAARSEEIAERVDTLALPFPDDREFEAERAQAWRFVAFAYGNQEGGAARSEEAAERVDTLALPFADDREFEAERAQAWRFVAFAYSKQKGGASRSEEAAERVDTLALPFAGDRKFEVERARAWRYVVYAYGNQEGGAARSEEAAERVDTLALPFADDREFEAERTQAWRFVAFAYSKQEGGAACSEEAAERVDTLAFPFADDREFELKRARAWRSVAFAYSKQEGGATRSEEAAERVDALALPFAGDREFELERAEAWRSVAFAYSKQDGGAARSEEAAERVDTLALPFAGDRGFELERAQAWRSVAFAYSNQDGGAARSEEAAERVDTLALPFADDREFELERAQAWRSVAVAYSNQDGGAVRSEEIAERVDTLALPFADDREFELERAQAWRFVAFAYGNQEGGAARSEEAAERVDTLALPFAGDREFELERARALNWAITGLLSTGSAECRDFDRAESLLGGLEALTAPFAGNPEFELVLASTWRHLACALFGGDPERAAQFAQQVADIAGQFPDIPEFAGQVLALRICFGEVPDEVRDDEGWTAGLLRE
ncbi:ATP-binding protein [Longimicrobium terrae]|uniref:Uncharacterized protein n=1 Tax=Longimicrobium terrae TaxID=1639882 RepID=A0A841GWT6_9BACT|nr:ATP-binding protein [Longimicrobium terrae]MBB4635897.1 hypothetical protein [Longimicrobium terrae]MBB6070293.1 hypothetical protein [Longimicrobium terrae]NNC30795.1 ATP-binding protein [Longimicrobium terrae]